MQLLSTVFQLTILILCNVVFVISHRLKIEIGHIVV